MDLCAFPIRSNALPTAIRHRGYDCFPVPLDFILLLPLGCLPHSDSRKSVLEIRWAFVGCFWMVAHSVGVHPHCIRYYERNARDCEYLFPSLQDCMNPGIGPTYLDHHSTLTCCENVGVCTYNIFYFTHPS